MPAHNVKLQESLSPSTVDAKQLLLKTRFFPENDTRSCSVQFLPPYWKASPRPEHLQPIAIVERLRQVPQPTVDEDDENTPHELDMLTMESDDNFQAVRKDSFFSEELTEEERELVAKRVAMHQRQFLEHERREKLRKSKKIRAMFEYVTDEEIDAMLLDCGEDEDEVICNLAQSGYLCSIRKHICTKYPQENSCTSGTIMNAEQMEAYQQLIKKRSGTLRKTTTDKAKKRYRMGGRLALDEAIQQAQKHQIDPEKAFEGWSEARIYAYKLIDVNPSSYYYRFNAPGEVQRRGQWSKEEKKLFFKRLNEVGATGQWGIFSMTIPGRVGYQCSNFYRHLLETKQITDPNYVLDENGKARYLFDKRDANGKISKTFRTHRPNPIGEGSSSASTSTSKSRRHTTNTNASNNGCTGRALSRDVEQQKRTRKRRRRFGRGESDGSDSGCNDDGGSYEDRSGSYTTRVDNSPQPEGETPGPRRSKRQRKPTAAAIEAGLVSGPLPSCPWDASITGTTVSCQQQTPSEEQHVSNEQQQLPNPLPGFIDPITLEEVIKPAISPYGHVMGYDSWVRCLTSWEGRGTQNVCPLTKKPLTKRDLVILDFDNIEEHRSRIVNS